MAESKSAEYLNKISDASEFSSSVRPLAALGNSRAQNKRDALHGPVRSNDLVPGTDSTARNMPDQIAANLDMGGAG